MQRNNKLALIVAYYLSRFYIDRKDRLPLEKIGIFSGITKAYEIIGERLDVNPRTLKNMRDHFDPLHGHRSGWYQEETRQSHLEVHEKYKDISEEALIEVVKDIIEINMSNKQNISLYIDAIEFDDEDNDKKRKREYGTRGITGRKAEEIFLEKYENGEINGLNLPIVDCRDNGCGYDFEIVAEPKIVFEIKGLAGDSGGVSFTDKEWYIAKRLAYRYNLVLISNVNEVPQVRIINDPYKKLTAKKAVNKAISISWSVDESQLGYDI